MRVTRTRGLSLLNERETQLVLASAPKNLQRLSVPELKRLGSRTRRIQLRYAGLARRQAVRARRQALPRTRETESTRKAAQKAGIFEQALERVEARRARLEAPSSGRTPATKNLPRTSARARRGAPPPSGPKSKRKTPVSRRAAPTPVPRRKLFHGTRRRAETSAQGRRHQGRKDQR